MSIALAVVWFVGGALIGLCALGLPTLFWSLNAVGGALAVENSVWRRLPVICWKRKPWAGTIGNDMPLKAMGSSREAPPSIPPTLREPDTSVSNKLPSQRIASLLAHPIGGTRPSLGRPPGQALLRPWSSWFNFCAYRCRALPVYVAIPTVV